jgi:hypothetical protein
MIIEAVYLFCAWLVVQTVYIWILVTLGLIPPALYQQVMG